MGKLLRSNLAFKIVSLLLAILLWIYVSNEQRTSQLLTVPLEVVNSNPSLVFMENPPTHVQVRVQGAKTILPTLEVKNIRAFVDLKNAQVGRGSYPVQVEVADNVEVISKNPSTVDLTFDMAEERSVEVVVKVTGEAAMGFRAMDALVEPAQVTLSGPANLLRQVDKALVEVELAPGAQETKVLNLPMRVVDKNGNGVEDRLIHYSPKTVEVTVPVVPEQPTKMVPVKVPLQGTPAAGFQVNRILYRPEVVKLIGIQGRLDQIDSVSTAPLDINGAQRDVVKEIPLRLLSEVGLVGSPMVKVTVEIGEKPRERKSLTDIPLEVKGLGVGLKAAFNPPQVTLTIEGLPETLSGLENKDITVYGDVTGLDVGDHTVTVQVVLPPGVKLINAEPAAATVTITR